MNIVEYAIDAATDEVTDTIAHIEMQRQTAEKESGLAVACSEALRRLRELLEHQSAPAGTPAASSAEHAANIEAVRAAIRKVEQLAGGSRPKSATSKPPRSGGQRASPPTEPRRVPRNKRRRRIGRRTPP
jgi:hypothetical protein